MKTAEVFETENGQAVRIPDEFRLTETEVGIRRQGKTLILEPVKPAAWPPNFFQAIRIDDPAFRRPDQGPTPPAPSLD